MSHLSSKCIWRVGWLSGCQLMHPNLWSLALGVYLPSSRTMHLVYPWAWPSHGSYLSRGSPWGDVGTSRVKLLPAGTRTMALKPPFSSLCNCSGPRLNLAMLQPGDASPWRRLTWRRPPLATPQAVNLLTFFLGFLEGPYHTSTFDFDFDFGQRPGTGRYRFLDRKQEKMKNTWSYSRKKWTCFWYHVNVTGRVKEKE